MRKARGFKLRGKLVKICKWVITRRPRRRKTLNFSKRKRNPISKVLNMARCLRRGAKRLMPCSAFHKSGYVRLGHDDPVEEKPGWGGGGGIPKGHLAVYVGESRDETQRYLVPVIYFNHPLFGELLKEAEKVYGFNHPGRITIPCGPSEFEKIQMRIASGEDYCRRQRRRIPKQAEDHYWWQ